MRLPTNHMLLSEDGKRGFTSWAVSGALTWATGFSITEFGSGRQWWVPVFQYNRPASPLVVTHWQWRDLDGFHNEIPGLGAGPERAMGKVLSSPSYDRVTLAHLDQPTHTEEGMRRYGGVSEIDVDDLGIRSNKLLYNNFRALSAIKDRATNAIMIKSGAENRYDIVGAGNEQGVGPIDPNFVPIHMDVAADILVLFKSRVDYPKMLEIWSIKDDKKLFAVSPPTIEGAPLYIRQTALLPNRALLASFEREKSPTPGDSKAAYVLYRLDENSQLWLNLGPFRLSGASNSGRVLLISKGPHNEYLVWPK
ncbi:MAG: hypothetical protein ACR2HJ_13400 [Fimbriimonadales bacterium]